MLHYLDDLDSKMEAMRAQFERESGFDSPWTSYNSSLGRPLLNTEKFLAPKKTSPPEDPAAARDTELDEAPDPAPTLPGVDSRR
jgi:3'-5' exoribonuclease